MHSFSAASRGDTNLMYRGYGLSDNKSEIEGTENQFCYDGELPASMNEINPFFREAFFLWQSAILKHESISIGPYS